MRNTPIIVQGGSSMEEVNGGIQRVDDDKIGSERVKANDIRF